MKQLEKLFIVCANRRNTLFQMLNGTVTVYIGAGPGRRMLSSDCADDDKISLIIRALNDGKHHKQAA